MTADDTLATRPGWRLWTRPYVRSGLFALVPLLFALPFISVEACSCYGGECRVDEDVRVDVRVEANGWQLLAGVTPDIETTVRDRSIGSPAEVQEQAEKHFGHAATPHFLLALLPAISVAGALLFFVHGRFVDAARSALALGGFGVLLAAHSAIEHDLRHEVDDFGVVLGVGWDDVDVTTGDGAISMGVIFVLLLLLCVPVALWRLFGDES